MANRKVLLFVIIASIITYLLIKLSFIIESNYRKEIIENQSFTVGKIDYITPGNDAFSMSLSYFYFVEGIKYSRIVEIPRNKRKYYKQIEDNNRQEEICFWVVYSDVERSNSLVDLVQPFICENDQSYPKHEDLSSFI